VGRYNLCITKRPQKGIARAVVGLFVARIGKYFDQVPNIFFQ